MRFFAANDGGLLSLMSISMLYSRRVAECITLPLGVNVGGKAWAPSLPTLITANLLGVLNGGKAAVAFRFTRSASARSGGSTTCTSIPWRATDRPAALTPCGGGNPPRGAQRAQGRHIAVPLASHGGAQAEGQSLRAVVDQQGPRARRAPTTSRRRRACRSNASPPNARAVLRPPRWRTTTSGCRTVGTPAARARRHRSMSS